MPGSPRAHYDPVHHGVTSHKTWHFIRKVLEAKPLSRAAYNSLQGFAIDVVRNPKTCHAVMG